MMADALVLAWETPEPAHVRDLLEAAGFAPGPGGALRITGLDVLVRETRGPDLLRGHGTAMPGAPTLQRRQHAAPAPLRLLALGVATVDVERAAVGWGGTAGELPGDSLLGARVARTADARVVLLEPTGEGRLAASLARVGEGPAAIYLEITRAGLERAVAGLAERGAGGRAGPGPFGPQHLAWARPPWGPHVLLVPPGAAAGTLDAGASATISP